MARKHPVSPNQTMLWSYQALAPAWGSPALVIPPQEQDDQLRGTATKDGRTACGGGQIKAKAKPPAGRQASSRGRSRRAVSNSAARTVLTSEAGVCDLVRLGTRHAGIGQGRRRRGRRAQALDLV
jgi:hypothetical protein